MMTLLQHQQPQQQNIDMSVVMQTIAQLTQQLAEKDRLISERDQVTQSYLQTLRNHGLQAVSTP